MEIDDSVIVNFNLIEKFLKEKGYILIKTYGHRKDIVTICKPKIKNFWFFGKRTIKYSEAITEPSYIYSKLFFIKCSSEKLNEIKKIFEVAYFPFEIKVEVMA